MAFNPTLLKDGTRRDDFIRKRLTEGATPRTIMAEMNSEALYSGQEGRVWPMATIYAKQRELGIHASQLKAAERAEAREAAEPKAAPVKVTSIREAHPEIFEGTEETGFTDEPAAAADEVPPEYEGILDSEDIASVRQEAKAAVLKDMRKAAREKLLIEAKANLKREALAEMKRGKARNDMVDVNIDLAPYADRITLDGEVFWYGQTYRVGRAVANSLKEQIARTWIHQEEITSQRDSNAFFKKKDNVLKGGDSGFRV